MQCFVGSTVNSFFPPFPSAGIQSTTMLPPLAATGCGSRGAFLAGSDGSTRPRPAFVLGVVEGLEDGLLHRDTRCVDEVVAQLIDDR